MVTIEIGREKRDIKNVDATWINQQINGLRRDEKPVRVRVNIKENAICMDLRIPNRPSGNRGRKPRPKERKILEFWEEHQLNTEKFNANDLVAFVKQLRNLLY